LCTGTMMLGWTLQLLQSLRELSIGEARPLVGDFLNNPEQPRKKFIRISCAIFYLWLACDTIFDAPWRKIAAGTHFSRAYISGSFSLVDLLIGPVYDLYNGILRLVFVPFAFWLAWKIYRKDLKYFHRKVSE